MSNKKHDMWLLPEPLKVIPGKGRCLLDRSKRMTVSVSGKEKTFSIKRWPTNAALFFKRYWGANNALPEGDAEQYCLRIKEDVIHIDARTAQGLFWALQTLYQIMAQYKAELPCCTIDDEPGLKVRGIHWYMKQKLAVGQVKQVLDFLCRFKANTFVLEYAEYFPFRKHAFISADNAFLRAEILELTEYARERFIDLVPLVNSLGHAEYILRHRQLKALREVPDNPHDFCPSNPAAMEVLKDLYNEVIELHPHAKLIHIGGDECVSIGSCPICHKRAQKIGVSGLYVSFYRELCDWLIRQGKRPILWSDMFVRHPERSGDLPKQTIIMDWNYNVYEWPSILVYDYPGEIVAENMDSKLVRSKYLSSFRKYWFGKNRKLKKFPFIKYFRDKGYDVLVAPTASCNGGTELNLPGRYRNAAEFALAAQRDGGLGIINTLWCGLRRMGITREYGFAAAATAGWHKKAMPLNDFNDRFVFHYYQADSAILRKCYALFGQAVEIEGIVSRVMMEKRVSLLGVVESFLAKVLKLKCKNHEHIGALLFAVRYFLLESKLVLCYLRVFLAKHSGPRPRYVPIALNRWATERFEGVCGNLATFPAGERKFMGIPFKIRAEHPRYIHLGSKNEGKELPRETFWIPVNQRVKWFYIIHSASYVPANGTEVGRYVIKYKNGAVRSVPIVVGHDLCDSMRIGYPLLSPDAVVGWFRVSSVCYRNTVLFALENPEPTMEVAAIKAVSNGICSIVILGMTAERYSGPDNGSISIKYSAEATDVLRELAAITLTVKSAFNNPDLYVEAYPAVRPVRDVFLSACERLGKSVFAGLPQISGEEPENLQRMS